MLAFVACAGTDTLTLADQTGGAAEEMLRDLATRDGLTTVLTRAGDQLLALHYVGVEGPSCADLPPSGEVEVRGQEPFWALTIADGEALYRTPDLLDGIRYSAGGWDTDSAGHLSWQAPLAPDAGSGALRLDLEAGTCADPMSDARYAWRATLHLADDVRTGCALLGRGFRGSRPIRE